MLSIGLVLSWALLFAVIAIRAYYRGPRWLYLVCRPLSMVLLVALVIEAGRAAPAYRTAIAAGLVASLAGDLFMMPRRKKFEAGLAAFLGAQACYAYAFSRGLRFVVPGLPAAALAAFAAALFIVLAPHLKKMLVPVLVYILAISAMALTAFARAGALGTSAALAGAAGAVLFLVSDSVLALDRFVRPFRAAQAVILSTYIGAQALIALSACL